MRFSIGLGKDNLEERLEKRGVSRRDFLKFCGLVSATMGLSSVTGPETVWAALTKAKRPSVVYLHGAECTGCSESLLRIVDPYLDDLIFDTISLDYHETLMQASGDAAEKVLHDAISSPEGFICIVEGAIPTAENGIYGKIGNRTMLDLFGEIVPKAKVAISYGTCSSYGGVQAAKPNPTGAMGISDALKAKGLKTINISGCPPNPINLVGTIVYLLKEGKAPELTSDGRPKMFFEDSVHDQCERRVHFDAGEFAPSFDSDEARKGWCLYSLGCKGPATFNNCPKAKFNQTNWPVGAGHPCIGCSEPGFWDAMSPFYES